MKKSTGIATLALALMFGASAAIDRGSAAPSQAALQTPQTRKTTEPAPPRLVRTHDRYADRRREQPHYYDRPTAYAPVPLFPSVFGIGFVPW